MSDEPRAPRERKYLWHVLQEEGLLTEKALSEARDISRKTGQHLVHVLVENRIVSEDDIAFAMAQYLGQAPITVSRLNIDPGLSATLDERVCRMCVAIPVCKTGHVLTVAMADPMDLASIGQLEKTSNLTVVPMVGRWSEIMKMIDVLYCPQQDGEIKDAPKLDEGRHGIAFSQQGPLTENAAEPSPADISVDDPNAGPVVKLVNEIMLKAIEMKASDIHIEPYEKKSKLRIRVDGSLQTINDDIPKSLHGALIARIKVMSQMRIDVKMVPQDQRARIKVADRPIDFRVSTVPAQHGEAVVMRILDAQNLKLNLPDLGFEPDCLQTLLNGLKAPYGMILVTGPTGSGKTTTLYSALSLLNQEDAKILTVEDPVEYQLEGIVQVQCRPDIDLTFANVLRSFLRQDPDIIMVGEIRDQETADIAIKAALTGHLVLSTLHTNTAVEAIVRLEDMGMEPFMVACSVVVATAQRLLKKLCETCKQPWEVPADVLKEWRVDPQTGKTVYKAGGKDPAGNPCPRCIRGYKGRLACMEAFAIDEKMRDLIMRRAPITEIHRAALDAGMMGMRQDAMAKVLRGVTTREEAVRATTD